MSKSNRMYKIFMTTMIVIIAGLLLATGIIAIQKSMKLKANIEFLPGINVEIYVKNENNPTETLIFRNFEDTSDANNKKYIEFNSTYCELSATTLTMKDAFVTAYGNNFTLVVHNFSGFTIETNITSTATAKIGENSVNAVPAEITPPTAQIATGDSEEFVVSSEPIIPQETILAIKFEELILYDIKATINGNDQLIGEYSPKSSSQEVDITYTDFYGLGGLLEEVSGVTELTSSKITIAANTTGPITIVPKGYWIGTYTSTYPSETVYDYDAQANIAVGTVWAGYKFLQFNGATDYGSYPMRWIIIGGDSANSTSTYGAGANKEYDTFSAKQVLLLSEKTLVSKQFHYSSAAWTGSTLQTWLNTQDTSGNFLPDSKMQSYYDNIATVTLQTAWSPNNNSSSTVLVELTNQKIFLLASKHGSNKQATNLKDTSGNYTYQNQNYMVEEYLGDETTYPGLGYENNNSTTCLKMFAFSGSNTSQNSSWWLRSGDYNYNFFAYRVDYIGDVGNDYVSVSYGVRPSFILNLA